MSEDLTTIGASSRNGRSLGLPSCPVDWVMLSCSPAEADLGALISSSCTAGVISAFCSLGRQEYKPCLCLSLERDHDQQCACMTADGAHVLQSKSEDWQAGTLEGLNKGELALVTAVQTRTSKMFWRCLYGGDQC